MKIPRISIIVLLLCTCLTLYGNSIYQGAMSFLYGCTLAFIFINISSILALFISFVGVIFTIFFYKPSISFIILPSVIGCIISAICIYDTNDRKKHLCRLGNKVSSYWAYNQSIKSILRSFGFYSNIEEIPMPEKLYFNTDAPLFPLYKPTTNKLTVEKKNNFIFGMKIPYKMPLQFSTNENYLLINPASDAAEGNIVAICEGDNPCIIAKLVFEKSTKTFSYQPINENTLIKFTDDTKILGKIIEYRQLF